MKKPNVLGRRIKLAPSTDQWRPVREGTIIGRRWIHDLPEYLVQLDNGQRAYYALREVIVQE